MGDLAFDGILEQDDWHYGNHYHKFADDTEMEPDLTRIELHEELFFEKFKEVADKMKHFNRNIAIINEGFSVEFGNDPWKFEKLKETLKDDWEVSIVVGYRPFFEWIPSMWTQVFKFNDQLYKERSELPWHHTDGNLHYVQSMFPKFFSWMGKKEWFSNSMVDFASPHLSVEIIDLHDPKGVSSVFICDILKASKTCEGSLRRDKEAKSAVVNKGSPSSVHYDAIGLEAAKKGYVNVDKWNRTDVSDAIEAYVVEELKMTAFDLPMICPDDKVMAGLLERSLRYDKQYAPKAADDPERQSKLSQDFMKRVEKKEYCFIDFEVVMTDSKWKSFFQKYG